MSENTGFSPLQGPFLGQTEWGDVALFTDESGSVAARMMIAPCFTVPVLVVADPDEPIPPQDLRGLIARCPLLGEPGRTDYGSWDDPAFRALCARFGIDPDKQRPRFDPWFEEVGETLLKTAWAAFEAKRMHEHSAAGLAAEALAKGADPSQTNMSLLRQRLDDIEDKALREKTRDALEQLARSADWKTGTAQARDKAVKEMIDRVTATGVPVRTVKDPNGPGGAVIFGDDRGRSGNGPGASVSRWLKRFGFGR